MLVYRRVFHMYFQSIAFQQHCLNFHRPHRYNYPLMIKYKVQHLTDSRTSLLPFLFFVGVFLHPQKLIMEPTNCFVYVSPFQPSGGTCSGEPAVSVFGLILLLPLLLMDKILHQLRLVVEIPSFTGFYTSQVVVWDFFHQQYVFFSPTDFSKAKNATQLVFIPRSLFPKDIACGREVGSTPILSFDMAASEEPFRALDGVTYIAVGTGYMERECPKIDR